MKEKYNRAKVRHDWVDFLESKGFIKIGDELEVGDVCLSFFGCNPQIRIDLYSGYYRTDTETNACICADFVKAYNKVSQCPVYFCDNVSHEKFWQAIELMMNAGVEWSLHGGRIEEGNGYLFCDPTIDKNNKEKIYKIKGKKK